MWSISPIRRLGGLSTRRIAVFVSVILLALFAVLTIQSSPAQAQQDTSFSGTATWSGEDIQYEGARLVKTALPNPNDDPNFPNLIGTFCDQNPNSYSSNVSTRDGDSEKDYYWIYVICMSDGYSSSDKTKPIPAGLLAYQTPKSSHTNTPSPAEFDKDGQQRLYQITISPATTDSTASKTTCSTEHTHGLGWIICPVTNLLADVMDNLYKQIQKFLVVTPLSTDTDGSMYLMWRMVRNLANIMFIIAFLFIIYSQITSYGMSNYGLKRLLPRLLIAAVLVNLSYWIVALAIDLSNITGKTMYDALVSIRESAPKPQGVDYDFSTLSWTTITSTILAGGAGGILIGGAVFGLVASAGGSLWFLLVGLAGVIAAGLIAVIILAARQALITVLVIISPLAFVAYLLPSTEKYFDKWKDLLLTLLLVYPIISIVFGGAQLAGLVIMQGAKPDTENAPIIIILGMIVQVAPLIITPLLIKVSGSLLGRIAGIVNNPNKGVIDQTRKFAQRRHDMTKNSMWASTGRDANGNIIYRRNDPFAMAARRKALRDMDFDHKLKTLESGAEAAYEQDHRSHAVHLQSSVNEMLKNQGESAGKAAVSRDIANTEALRRLYYQQQLSHEQAETETKAVSTMYEGLKADPNRVTTDALERTIGEQAQEVDRRARSITSREAVTKHEQEKAYNKAIEDSANVELREFAGFNAQGVAQVVNLSQEAEAKRYESLVEAGKRTLMREEATLDELKELIKTGTSSNAKFSHFSGDTESKAAAIRMFMDTAPMKMRHELAASMDLSKNAPRGSIDGVFRSEIAGGLAKNKPFFISQTFLNQMAEGRLDPIYNDVEGRNRMIADTLNKFAFDAQSMVSIDQDDIGAIADFLESSQRSLLTAEAEAQIVEALGKAFNKADRYEGQMGKRRGNLNRVRSELGLPPITK